MRGIEDTTSYLSSIAGCLYSSYFYVVPITRYYPSIFRVQKRAIKNLFFGQLALVDNFKSFNEAIITIVHGFDFPFPFFIFLV